jgi:hypothetical protein
VGLSVVLPDPSNMVTAEPRSMATSPGQMNGNRTAMHWAVRQACATGHGELVGMAEMHAEKLPWGKKTHCHYEPSSVMPDAKSTQGRSRDISRIDGLQRISATPQDTDHGAGVFQHHADV